MINFCEYGPLKICPLAKPSKVGGKELQNSFFAKKSAKIRNKEILKFKLEACFCVLLLLQKLRVEDNNGFSKVLLVKCTELNLKSPRGPGFDTRVSLKIIFFRIFDGCHD